MQIKDIVKIRIDSVAFGGEGVGRIDNFVVFVPFSASGDELEIEVIQLKKNFVRGRKLRIIKNLLKRTIILRSPKPRIILIPKKPKNSRQV